MHGTRGQPHYLVPPDDGGINSDDNLSLEENPSVTKALNKACCASSILRRIKSLLSWKQKVVAIVKHCVQSTAVSLHFVGC